MNSKACIRFHNLRQTLGRVDLTVEEGRHRHNLWFEHPLEETLDTSNLAIALSTLAGTAYDSVVFDFPVDSGVVSGIAEWTRSEVEVAEDVKGTSEPKRAHRVSAVLNFSGGFDSLAAKFLLPPETELVSLDFGGRFGREAKFFSQFHPMAIRTNLVETPLRANSWSFMGMGPLLLRQNVKAKFFAFGSIYEATGFRRVNPNQSVGTFPPFKLAGYQNVSPVRGVSEFGTARILLSHRPDLIEDSLNSLASPGEEKHVRKILITRVVAEQMGIDVKTPQLPRKPRIHYRFGQNFAVDMTALYFSSLGLGEYSDQLVEGMPEQVRKVSSVADFSFMEKINGALYSDYPSELRESLEKGLSTSSMSWYDRQDNENLESLRHLLSAHYDFG
mgnify:FL=1